MIGIICGFRAEADIALKLAVDVAIGGGTTLGAEQAARNLIKSGVRTLLSFGIAGALAPDLQPGDLIIGECVQEMDAYFLPDHTITETLMAAFPNAKIGKIYATDYVVGNRIEKQRLFSETGASAIDMESGAVARVAQENGCGFAVLRAISDPASRGLPHAAINGLTPDGKIAYGAILKSLMKNPGQLPALLQTGSDAAASRKALLGCVDELDRVLALGQNRRGDDSRGSL